MYPRDHKPPHVHVEFRDGERCSIMIKTLEVVGEVRPQRRLAEALSWIGNHQSELLAKWDEINR